MCVCVVRSSCSCCVMYSTGCILSTYLLLVQCVPVRAISFLLYCILLVGGGRKRGGTWFCFFLSKSFIIFLCCVCLSDWLTDALGDMNRKRDSLYKYLHVCSIFNIFFNICWSSKLYYFSSHLLLKLLLILLRIAYTFTHICTPGFIPIWARFAPTTCLQLVIFEQIKPIFGVTGNGE